MSSSGKLGVKGRLLAEEPGVERCLLTAGAGVEGQLLIAGPGVDEQLLTVGSRVGRQTADYRKRGFKLVRNFSGRLIVTFCLHNG